MRDDVRGGAAERRRHLPRQRAEKRDTLFPMSGNNTPRLMYGSGCVGLELTDAFYTRVGVLPCASVLILQRRGGTRPNYESPRCGQAAFQRLSSDD